MRLLLDVNHVKLAIIAGNVRVSKMEAGWDASGEVKYAAEKTITQQAGMDASREDKQQAGQPAGMPVA